MRTCMPYVAAALLLILGAADIAAQQLPPATAPVPPLRRGPGGQIEVAPANPEPPAAAAKSSKPRRETTTPSQPAPPPASTSPTPVLNAAPAGPPQAIAQGPAEISLPEPFALEMPSDAAELAPSDARLRSLLGAAASGKRQVTNDQTQPIRVGPVRINFAAWPGEPWKSAPVGVRSAILHVLPPGTAPVGISGDENATAGNNSAKLARDAAGRVHLVWLDSGRPGTSPRVLYRRATVSPDNAVVWETDPVPVDDAGVWNAYPALAVAGNTVHIAWQGERTARHRRLSFENGAWRWGRPRDTTAASAGVDIGPAIAATTAGLVHVATPSGFDAVSRDNGETWKAEPIPLPPGRHSKTVSVALDRLGNAHFALSVPVRGPEAASQDKPSRGYWELRYIRRGTDGVWSALENALTGLPGWAESAGEDDVLTDWVRILADDADNLHLTWHGSAETRIYGNDYAYYMRRPATGQGTWRASWETPFALVPHPPAKSRPFSFAPALALDGETAVVVAFYDVFDGDRFVGFDALARLVRGGTADAKSIPIAEFSRRSIDEKEPGNALSTRFPAAAPQLWRDRQGRIWLDLLETLIPFETDPKLIVYQRVDLTSAIGGK
jgi:hypothetical protein